ncbi:MAG: hypothetical protein M1830_002401, partial [Pleopsidium flavum]
MVIRKPVASGLSQSAGQQTSTTPSYPVVRSSNDGTNSNPRSSWTGSDTPSPPKLPTVDLRHVHGGLHLGDGSGGLDMRDPWAHVAAEREQAHNQLPPALRVGQGRQSTDKNQELKTISTTLRMGQLEGTPRTLQQLQQSDGSSIQPVWSAAADASKQQQHSYKSQHATNMFSRTHPTGVSIEQQVSQEEESSAGVWNEMAAQPHAPQGVPVPRPDEREG